MVMLNLDNEDFADILVLRLKEMHEFNFCIKLDKTAADLFYKKWLKDAESGIFDNWRETVDTYYIMKTDYCRCEVIVKGEEKFEELKEIYKKFGFGEIDCSENPKYEEEWYCISIEAVDYENDPEAFLIEYL